MSNKNDKKSFWATLPGILTGIAAIITAIGGILVLLPAITPQVNDEVQVVVVEIVIPVINYFTAEDSTLSWSVDGATTVTIYPDPSGIGSMGLTGTMPVSPDETTTYTLTATNEAGTVTDQAVVEVIVIPVINYFKEENYTLSWSVDGATTVTIDQGIEGVVSASSRVVSPTETTTYTLTATNEAGSVQAQAVVEVIEKPVINYFKEENYTLSWSVDGATTVTIDQGIEGVVSASSRVVSPTETTTYTLTATNEAGSVQAQAVVTCEPPRVIRIGITTGSTSGLETTVTFVEEILEPDIAAYVDMLGYDITFDFIVKDNHGSAVIAVENTQTYRAMGIDLIIGHGWSSQCQASLRYVTENDMLLFSASSTSPVLAIPDDRLFRACPIDIVQAPALADMWETWGVKAVLIMFRADMWGDSLYNVLSPELADRGIVELGRLRYAVEMPEFSSYLAAANESITDAIAMYGKERVGIQFFSSSELRIIQSQAADYPNLVDIIWMTADSGGRDQVMLNVAGEWATKTRHFSALMAADEDSSEFIEFDERYYELTGYRADFYTAAQYDACRLLVECILETDSAEASEIARLLIPMSQWYYGLTGWMSLDENGDRQPQMFDIWGFYEESGTGDYLFMKFGEYDGQKGEVYWDDDALVDLAGIERPGH